MKKLAFLLILALALAIGVSAKEVVIYENDFSNPDLADFTMKGTMEVTENGGLKAVGTGTSAYVSYTFPEEHHGKDYIVEVDYIGATAMGGILIGATGEKVTSEPKYFSGYTVTTDGTASKIMYAFFNETGWGGDFAKTPEHTIKGKDFHLWVYVSDRAMTFRATSLDGETLYQGMRYDYGFFHTSDIYDTPLPVAGLRQYYTDNGYFDNFKVSVVEPDEIPALGDSVTAGETAFASNGITAQNGVATGNGVMLSKDELKGNYRISGSVANKNMSRIYFGMSDDNKNGYAFDIDSYMQTVTLNKIENGEFQVLQIRSTIVRDGFVDFYVDVHDGIVTISYDNLFVGEEALPVIELYLDDTDGKFGFWLEGGQIKDIAKGDAKIVLPEETYINAINVGADPDVLFYNGTYYLYIYNDREGGNDVFKVYTSPNLVDWTYGNVIFTWDEVQYSNVNGKTAWSPNVFYNQPDGLFYLTFAAQGYGGDSSTRKVYYATSDSPYGPFVHDGPLVPVNPDVNEIDGHVFVGYDGKTYMSFSRYDAGGTIWLEEVIIKDGVITAIPSTATRAIVPTAPWDNDGATCLVEGGFVWKHGGYYYMIYATASYARHYGEAVAVSKNPLGPYEKLEHNPILNWNYIIDGPGDALMINSPDGTETYMIYHRHIVPGEVTKGRETNVDLVKFVKDPDGGPDILTIAGPSSTPKALPSNQYRYDVNRDGTVTIADVMTVYRNVRNASVYSGWYDVDANGSLGMSDVLALLAKVK